MGAVKKRIDNKDLAVLDCRDDPPILGLIKRLLKNKNRKILMTDAEIRNVLEVEFDISTNANSSLEIDIYSHVLKKFLKLWPDWDDVENIATNLLIKQDYAEVKIFLNKKYSELKQYLGVMLDAAKPATTEAIQNIAVQYSHVPAATAPAEAAAARTVTTKPIVNKGKGRGKGQSSKHQTTEPDNTVNAGKELHKILSVIKTASETEDNVVMEIECTRQQLNNLFFRRPRTDLNNTIFNVSRPEQPLDVKKKPLSYLDMLNFWWLKINICLPYFIFSREVAYKLQHKLVNKTRQNPPVVEETHSQAIDTTLYQNPEKDSVYFEKVQVYKRMNLLLLGSLYTNKEMQSVVKPIFQVIKADIEATGINAFQVPASYKMCANKYRYIRFLYTENEQNNDPKYDLQLEETASPTYQFFMGKMGNFKKPTTDTTEWLKIECVFCKLTFKVDVHFKEALQAHFVQVHQDEPDWKCTNCSKTFTMEYLATNKWKHNC